MKPPTTVAPTGMGTFTTAPAPNAPGHGLGGPQTKVDHMKRVHGQHGSLRKAAPKFGIGKSTMHRQMRKGPRAF